VTRRPAYSFDTSAFVDPWRRYYPEPTFPSLWIEMGRVLGSGAVVASDSVHKDLRKKPDDLLAWVEKHGRGVFRPDDAAVQREAKRIIKAHPGLITTTHGHSDPFVIAHAIITGTTVVTQERSKSLANPRIPDVCAALAVPCIAPLDLMRREGWRF
jgi:hypothetical protein